MSIFQKFLFGCALISLTACAAKHLEAVTPQYATGSREALLIDYQSSGSPCLDALIVNLSNVGCNEAAAVEVSAGRMVGCLNPSPGATDLYSNSSFLHTLNPPQDFMPWCGDHTGIWGIYEGSLQDFLQSRPQ